MSAFDAVQRLTQGRAPDAAPPEPPQKNPAAVALGRKGGLKGGKSRMAALSPEERKALAKRAAAKRWGAKD